MKKIISLFVLMIILTSIQAQRRSSLTWFSLGLNGGAGTSVLFNQPSFDDVNVTYAYYSPSYFYGGNFRLIFGDNIGVSVEISKNHLSQSYKIHGIEDFSRIAHINSFDLAFLLNLQASTGFYFQVGPKFSTLKNAYLINLDENVNTQLDRTNKFRPQFTSLVFGIGLKPVMTQVFEMKIGVRGAYTFSNVVNIPHYIIPADDNQLYAPAYTDEKTTPIQLMLTMEFDFVFGKMGKASCGKTRFMFNM